MAVKCPHCDSECDLTDVCSGEPYSQYRCCGCGMFVYPGKVSNENPDPTQPLPDPPPAPPEPRGHHWLQDARIADLVERVEALEYMNGKLTDAVEEMVGAIHGLSERLSPTK